MQKAFHIPVSWTMSKTIMIQAGSLDEAKSFAEEGLLFSMEDAKWTGGVDVDFDGICEADSLFAGAKIEQ
tara:strand:- start:280 stop:489 length:210 start_codon:yes stop_codon:yes gene_type:complete